MSEDTVSQEQLAAEPVLSIEGFPTTQDFLDPAREVEAVAVAAYEICKVLIPLTEACVAASKSPLPLGAKMAFVMRARRAANDLYVAVPNQWAERVAEVVGAELAQICGVAEDNGDAEQATDSAPKSDSATGLEIQGTVASEVAVSTTTPGGNE